MRRIWTFFFSTALVVTVAGTAARAADLSDPKATVATFEKAVASEDTDTVKSCFTTADPNRQAMVDGMAGMIVASHHLQAAATNKFGDDGKSFLSGARPSMGDAFSAGMQRLKDADEKIDGDSATLTPKPDANAPAAAPPAKPFYFKKVGGDWKIDVDTNMPAGVGRGAAGGNASPGGQLVGKMTGIMLQAMNDTADDIKAGKYKTADDARQGLQQKMREAFMAAMQQQQQDGGSP